MQPSVNCKPNPHHCGHRKQSDKPYKNRIDCRFSSSHAPSSPSFYCGVSSLVPMPDAQFQVDPIIKTAVRLK